MVDDLKSLKDNLFKVLASRVQTGDEDLEDDDEDVGKGAGEGSFMDSSAARAVISTLFARAGKSKDEVVQILAREIGMAVAGMLKQPLSELAKHQKLQITFEFVPKKGAKISADVIREEEEEKPEAKKSAASAKATSSKKPSRPQNRFRPKK